MSAPPPQDRRALARQLRARRQALRALLKQRRREAHAQLQQRRALAGSVPRRRRRAGLLLLLLLILLLVQIPVPEPEPEPGVAGPGEGTPEPVAAEPLPKGRIARRDRPSYESEAPVPLPWLSSFRMQVAARSPRLAACFVGTQRPGALKWTTAVEPTRGHVSDHELEPMLLSDALSREQRACVLGVLSEPPYQLEADGERATPSRVGMVIEF